MQIAVSQRSQKAVCTLGFQTADAVLRRSQKCVRSNLSFNNRTADGRLPSKGRRAVRVRPSSPRSSSSQLIEWASCAIRAGALTRPARRPSSSFSASRLIETSKLAPWMHPQCTLGCTRSSSPSPPRPEERGDARASDCSTGRAPSARGRDASPFGEGKSPRVPLGLFSSIGGGPPAWRLWLRPKFAGEVRKSWRQHLLTSV